MWDLYYTADPHDPSKVHLHYLVNATIFPPAEFVTGNHWYNGLGHAVSEDYGVHWVDKGPVEELVLTEGSGFMGSGSINYRPESDDFVLSYSEDHSTTALDQVIYFATSKSLDGPWVVENKTFTYADDINGYYVANDRWDAINFLPDPSGGYYGYFTALPATSDEIGAGFAHSDDSINWKTLPSPGPSMDGWDAGQEVGGVAKANGTTWMLYGAGHLFSSESEEGPFVANEGNFLALNQSGGLFYPRIWGENYHHQEGEQIWITHHTHATDEGGDELKSVYAAPIKSMIVMSDGVGRAMWYSPNDSLRGEAVTVCDEGCLEGGVVVEGAGVGGLWIELEGGEGWMVRYNAETKVFENGKKETAGGRDDWVGSAVVTDRGDFLSLTAYDGVEESWRALVKTGFTGRTMVEFYQNGVLATPWTLPAGATGKFVDGAGGDVKIYLMTTK